jgi:hypothetical protein
MTRRAFAPALVVVFSATTASAALAQAAQTAASTAVPAPAPAARAKWMAPVKGTATIEVIRGNPKQVGNEVHTLLKVKNTSAAPIALLRADEYWYNKKREMVTGDTQRYQKPFQPGEIIEITMKSPLKPDLLSSQVQFQHAHGKVDAKGVKKFQ